MSKLLTYEEFLNESKKLNEAAPYTVDKYIKDSDGDDFWINSAKNVIKYMKLPANKIVWVTSDDDDDKFEQIQSYWEDEADQKDFTKQITGEASSDGVFYFADNIPMCKYEESGIEAFMLPIGLYKTLGED
jgi:hypothetical protein